MHCIAVPCIAFYMFDSFSLFTSAREEGVRGDGVRSRMRMDFSLSGLPFLVLTMAMHLHQMPCRLDVASPPPSSSCFAHAPPSFSMTSSNGQHYRGHRYGLRIALKLARKKKKQRNARWHFLSVAATDPLPFMVSRGGKKHFRILMCRLLPFMAAQLTTTTAT